MTFFLNGACAVRGGIPVRMLQINLQQANAFDVNVILRKALFANVLRKRRNIQRWPDVNEFFFERRMRRPWGYPSAHAQN